MPILQKLLKVNYTQGRRGHTPIMVVIHIGGGTQKAIYQTFANPYNKVSSHYSVDTNGEISQFVDEINTAWANGIEYRPTAEIVLANKGINKNLISCSIEHSGTSDITEQQYQATGQLVREICERWKIPIDRKHIIGHREIRRDKWCPARINIEKIIGIANGNYIDQISKLRKLLDDLKGRLQIMLQNKDV